MNVLVKKVKIIDEKSAFHDMIMDIHIVDGIIKSIEDTIDVSDAKIIHENNLHISPGWVDLKVSTGDPGFEHKETIESTLDIASKGGFTHICSLPSNIPVTDCKAQVQYQLKKSENHIVQLHPIGTITKAMQGLELSEMFDLHQSGCSLFSDDNGILDTGIMYRALLYAKNFNGKIILNLNENNLSSGIANEGIASLKTGLKSNSRVGEIIQLEKIIRLVDYVDYHVHVTGISCTESIELIKNAKTKGKKITCDVNLMNLLFNEEDLLDFNTMMKVIPVLRSKNDQKDLIKAVQDGIIDFIVSDHRPVDQDDKESEMDHATFGCYQLQTLFSSLLTKTNLPLNNIIHILSVKNRSMIQENIEPIAVGMKADFTLFNPNDEIKYDENIIKGNGKWNPFYSQTLQGKVLGIIKNDLVNMIQN